MSLSVNVSPNYNDVDGFLITVTEHVTDSSRTITHLEKNLRRL